MIILLFTFFGNKETTSVPKHQTIDNQRRGKKKGCPISDTLYDFTILFRSFFYRNRSMSPTFGDGSSGFIRFIL